MDPQKLEEAGFSLENLPFTLHLANVSTYSAPSKVEIGLKDDPLPVEAVPDPPKKASNSTYNNYDSLDYTWYQPYSNNRQVRFP